MTPAILQNQRLTFLRLWHRLAPSVRLDRNLPARIQELLRDRSFGSRDRRLYRELLYTAVRHLPWVEGRPDDELAALVATLAGESAFTAPFKEQFARPDLVAGLSRENLLPGWLRAECPEAFAPDQLAALNTRAPLWLRLQTPTPEKVFAEFQARSWDFKPSKVLADAVKLLDEADLAATTAYKQGWIEIQDLGSQMILEAVGVVPESQWLDACAGAGGKTLQLAGLVGPIGWVDAGDIRAAALFELRERARRAGLKNIRIVAEPPVDATYDAVLVDAPCSGTGTWRRAPHLKWCTTPTAVANHAAWQRELLARYSRVLRPGGILVYATCSLCRSENEAVIEAFLSVYRRFAPVAVTRTFGFARGRHGLAILPARHDTDAFFVAVMQRK
ncbi:MAG: hypothetical protein A3G75_12815 [Verrucomicrobia bacterium RIFCSPLOWO2_12_FULL_64_8]|nr:MAG: hypothetical protein A3G75_12815 [Verrucomicrobia bacterium RIFCSPLOWO2_12_FULL_64_8]